MNRRQLLLDKERHAIDFSHRMRVAALQRLSPVRSVMGTCLLRLGRVVFLRTTVVPAQRGRSRVANSQPAETQRMLLRLRLADEGILTTFYGDEFVQSLIGRVPTVDLADLMRTMKAIAVGSPDEYSTPIVLSIDNEQRPWLLLGNCVSELEI